MSIEYFSVNRYPGDGVTTVWDISFIGGYIDREHVKAFILDADGVQTDIPITDSMFVTPFRIDLGVAAPVGGEAVLYRDTPKDVPLVDFQRRSRLTEANLDKMAQQSVFGVAEIFDAATAAGVVVAEVVTAGAAAGLARDASQAAEAGAIAARTAAETARDQAQASATAAAGSASSAANSVTTINATIADATTAATAEATAQANASASAAAASASSASAASGSASAAAASATSAQSSADSAAASAAEAAASAAVINPSAFVQVTGDQTIGGVKTFGGSPRIRNTNPTLFLQDTDGMSAMLHCDGNLFYVLRGGVDSATGEQINGRWPLTVNLANNDVSVGGNFTANGQFIGNGAGLTNVNATNVTGTAGQLGFSVNSTIGFGGRGGPEVTGHGGGAAAMMSFHRPGNFAVNFGLDGNDIAVGGWSFGNVSWRILHEGNWRGIIGAAHVGGVGTYAMLSRPLGANGSTNPGVTLAGSNLRYAGGLAGIGFTNPAPDQTAISTTAPAGTWRCMGFERSFSGDSQAPIPSMTWAALWLRIS